MAEEVKFTLEDTLEVQKAEMKDDYLYGKIMLRKTDGATGKALAGAEFEIRNKTTGMTMETLVTDAEGKAESSNLLIGTYGTEGLRELFEYECVETKAPEGYVLDDTVHPVRFELENQTDDHIVVTLEVKNQPAEEAPGKSDGRHGCGRCRRTGCGKDGSIRRIRQCEIGRAHV